VLRTADSAEIAFRHGLGRPGLALPGETERNVVVREINYVCQH
jgi:hypothetical protein